VLSEGLTSHNVNYRLLVSAFCVASGAGVEWSLAWPGMGMSFDCCVLLMSDFVAEVLEPVFLVGPAGTVPTKDD